MHRAPFTNHLSTLHETKARRCFVHRSVLALFLCALFLAIGVTRTAATSRTASTPDFAITEP